VKELKKSLRIPSKFVHLKEVESFIEDVVSGCNLNQRKIAFIRLGVCESVNNAIDHGNKCDENKYVTLFAEFTKDAILFEVHDEGDGFDYKNIPDPTSEDRIKSEGGRGLFIIHNLVDQVSFEKDGSIIQLKFNIDRANIILP